MPRASRYVLLAALTAATIVVGTVPAAGRQLWSGRDYHFEKLDFADWNLPENQDRITDVVWITRKSDHGIFNIAQEQGYVTNVSPADTEWAIGNAVDWESLSFQPWQLWAGNFPPGIVGVDACVYLISDDIYIDIRFDSWTQSAQGGGFAYHRANDPTPVERGGWGAVKALFR
jgi:hypothetical protein